jgi:hypothetical protein
MEGAHIAGVSEIQALLKGKILKADLAAVAIVRRAQAVVEANAKSQFTGSHAKGSPTTSSPGSPPDVVTGTLRRSIKSSRVQKGGFAEDRSTRPLCMPVSRSWAGRQAVGLSSRPVRTWLLLRLPVGLASGLSR